MDIEEYLKNLNLEHLIHIFEQRDIDFELLRTLDDDDYSSLGISLGDRKRIQFNIPRSLSDTSISASPLHHISIEPGERRHVSFMMCDLVNYSLLSKLLDQEDLRKVITQFRECCLAIVLPLEGEIRQHAGDGLLAYFGYPVAHRDDASRAVRAGIEVIRSISSIQLPIEWKLDCRVGVSTGEVVVDPMTGMPSGIPGSAHGDAPNLSERLQSQAKPGTLLVCESTKKLSSVDYMFRRIKLGPVKNFAELSTAYQYISESKKITNVGNLSDEAIDTKYFIVGRTKESQILNKSLQRCLAGTNVTLAIVGDSGCGKSTLVNKFVSESPPFDVKIANCYCRRGHTNTAWHPVLQLFSNIASDSENQPKIAISEKVGDLLIAKYPEFEKDILDIAPIFDMSVTANSGNITLTKEQLKNNAYRVLTMLVKHESRKKCLALIFEDIQWMDNTSKEFVLRLSDECIPNLLIVWTLRLSSARYWLNTPNVEWINLEPLSTTESKHLLLSLSKNSIHLHNEIVESIVTRTSGIPLFIEEFAKYIDSEIVSAGELTFDALPIALKGTIIGRIDRITQRANESKYVVQVCSISENGIAKNHLLSILSSLSKKSIDHALELLVESGLIIVSNKVIYFKHELVRESVYKTLLRTEKQRIHSSYAALLETESAPHRPRKVIAPAVVAHHYNEGGKYLKAIDWWKAAGDAAELIASTQEAAKNYRYAIDLLESNSDISCSPTYKAKIYLEAGTVFRSAYGTSSNDAKDCFEKAEHFAIESPSYQLCHSLYGQFASHFTMANYELARSKGERLYDLTKVKIEDESKLADFLAVANQAIGLSNFMNGNFEDAEESFRDALRVINTTSSNINFCEYPYTSKIYLAWSLLILGNSDYSLQIVDRCISEVDVCTPFQKALILTNVCYYYYWLGETENLIRTAKNLMKASNEYGLPVWESVAQFFLYLYSYQDSKEKESNLFFKEFLKKTEKHEKPFFTTLVAEYFYMNGDTQSAFDYCSDAALEATSSGEIWYQSQTLCFLSLLGMSTGQLSTDECKNLLRQAYVIAKNQKARFWMQRFFTHYDLIEKISFEDIFVGEFEDPRASDILSRSDAIH